MRFFILAVLLMAIGALAACVSDAPVMLDSGVDSSIDSPVSDAGADTGPDCSSDNTAGVLCVDTRCKAMLEFCCIGLGGGIFTGTCHSTSAVGDAGFAAFCQNLQSILVPCTKARDCQSGGDRCCIPPGLFIVADASTCPILLDVPMGSNGASPFCSASGCPNATQACSTDLECLNGKKCKPAMLRNFPFGVCQ